ncbi:MAG: CoA-binding protein [Gemmatimonadota bacterium]|jgi:predicted CoA-binding protein
MDDLQELRLVLEASSDEGNPDAEELRDLMSRVERIGVIGLSRFLEKPARRVPSYLAAKGYEIVPINPEADRILGQDVYDRLSDVPGDLDMVMVFRPSAEAGTYVHEIMERPERPVVWLQEGITAPAEIDEARAAGYTAVQDLCAFKVHRALYG